MSESANTETVRVLVVSQMFPPESVGGAHRWQQMSRHLPERFEPHVVCPPPSVPCEEFDRTYRPWKRERVEGVPVTRLWTYQPAEDRSNFARILNYAIFAVHAALYVLCTWWRYDCVVTLVGPHSTLLPGVVAKALGRGWVVDVFDLWIDNAADFGFVSERSISYSAVSYLERLAITHADHVTVITPTMARQYREKYDVGSDQFTVLPFGVNTDLFDGASGRSVPRVVYTGKLGVGQAFEPFLRGFADLTDDYDHELLMVGFGERREELEALCDDLGIGSSVTFRGVVPREEVADLVASSTLSWVPLKTDHQLDYARPTKFLETMAVGTPYVASETAEIRSVTDNVDAGIAVANDPNEIADAMRRLIADDEKRRGMGERGVEFIATNHRWETIGERAGSVLSKVARESA
ncbi:glycosyltransferase family 4 protein [Haladaptatus salinisoli]|uniref:glycosyltransferase family 4 protein n=1 Tax=Haladaptatus salinisoli TaxID=2884876 RepID=UPI001D0AC7A0|nr:glycosyltransferase family 4 protein [Haladaptatus salinisoli]